MSELDQIIEAMEDCAWVRALALARSMRERAVEGWAEPYEGTDRTCFNFDPCKRYVDPDAIPALLIPEPTEEG